ncbi:MAG: hypothetical protein K2G77_01140 [Muribaculaceae bacterium]|nr:hypothetical protein [Muribaculaceae bacterium]
MKNKIFNRLVTMILLLTMTSCHDTETYPDEPIYPGIDSFEGRIKEFFLTDETDRFDASDCNIKILAPDRSVISRKCTHTRTNGKSTFNLETGLKEGEYRLLYIEYPIEPIVTEDGTHKITTRQFGLGCAISADKHGITVKSNYNSQIGLSGEGTADDPYIVCSYDHLMILAHDVNSDATNSLINEDTYFKQIVEIDMDDACFFTDLRYGWEPIGNDCNLPFRGNYLGDKLTNIWSFRDKSPAIGLFGYIHKAKIDGIQISDSEFSGNFAVGSVVGAVITSGANRDRSEVTNCLVENSKITGSNGSVGIGGIIGAVDMNAKIALYECHNDNTTVTGDYNIGGIMGSASAYSLTSVNSCTNEGKIKSGFSGAGGIIGSCDTVYATSCKNLAEVIGGDSYRDGDKNNAAIGTGGIVGGSGVAFITGCMNTGNVTGKEGVGGMLGSTRIVGDEKSGLVYNNAAFRYCENQGDIHGKRFIGGINGESQFGSFGSLNSGKVSGDSYVAGIVGNASVCVAHNNVNTGNVTGVDYTAGIIGKSTFGSIAINDNYGDISATGKNTAGIVALAGNNIIIHYCSQNSKVENPNGTHVGGIVGEVGDPKKWTGWNIAECVIGSAEIAMSVVGPALSIAMPFLEESVHTISALLEFSEISFDWLLHASDAILWADGIEGFISGESSEEVSEAIKHQTLSLAEEIIENFKTIRNDASNYSYAGAGIEPLFTHGIHIADLADWYAQSGNDELFNDALNECRIERMEKVENLAKGKEIFHQVIGGVCIAVGTVASVGAMVVTGGAAAPFVIAGAAASFVGGVNAVWKTCAEFEENVVIISQCINSGLVIGGERTGGLVGTLHEQSIITDCLNAGKGNGKVKPFAGHYDQLAGCIRCVLSGTDWDGHDIGALQYGSGVVRRDGKGPDKISYHLTDQTYLVDGKELNNPKYYQDVNKEWDISSKSTSHWMLSGYASDEVQYPVPTFSMMRKK